MVEHVYDRSNFKELHLKKETLIKINTDDSRDLAIQVIDILLKSSLSEITNNSIIEPLKQQRYNVMDVDGTTIVVVLSMQFNKPRVDKRGTERVERNREGSKPSIRKFNRTINEDSKPSIKQFNRTISEDSKPRVEKG